MQDKIFKVKIFEVTHKSKTFSLKIFRLAIRYSKTDCKLGIGIDEL